jgi:hypothetical protein
MTEEQAIATVERRRAELRIARTMKVVSAQRAIVQFKRDRETPGPAEDRVAWIITLVDEGGEMRVDLDDRSGEILLVESLP